MDAVLPPSQMVFFSSRIHNSDLDILVVYMENHDIAKRHVSPHRRYGG